MGEKVGKINYTFIKDSNQSVSSSGIYFGFQCQKNSLNTISKFVTNVLANNNFQDPSYHSGPTYGMLLGTVAYTNSYH